MKKIGMVLVMLFLAVIITKTPGTNSFFISAALVESNTMTAGWWVPPKITFTSPAHNEIWQVGATETISWTATLSDPHAMIDNLKLEYKCGDADYSEIHTFSSNPGSYDWTVPENISDECKIKITATDSHGLTNSAESEEFGISYMITLNEFMPNAPSGQNEFVELYNYGTKSIDVSGWHISDSYGPGSHMRLIDNSHTNTGSTVIDPSSSRFLVVEYSGDGFYFNNTGSDTVKLFNSFDKLIDSKGYTIANVSGDTDPNNTKGAGNTLDGSKNETSEGKTWARVPDGVGDWYDPVPTPGKKNTDKNDLEDFQKYYKKECFKDGKPICDFKFLKSIGLVEDKKTAVTENQEKATIDNPSAENDTAPEDKPKESVLTTPADAVPTDGTSGTSEAKPDGGTPPVDAIVPVDTPPVKEETPKVEMPKVEAPKAEVEKDEVKKVEEPKKDDKADDLDKPKEEAKQDEVKKEDKKEEEAPKEDAVVSEVFDYLRTKNTITLC